MNTTITSHPAGSPPGGDHTSSSRGIALLARRDTLLSRVFLAMVALAVGACGGGDGTDTTTGGGDTPTSGSNEVVMQSISFQPGEITVEVGDEVTWTNEDGVTHTATSEDTLWDSGDLASGESFSHTFDEPGTYSYVCQIHPSMQATVTVEE